MRVDVRLFAGLREQAGTARQELDLPAGARVRDAWASLELGDLPPGLLFAVNRRYADVEAELADGDELALIPPVSGGSVRVTEEPLSLDAAVAEVLDPRAGAVATFTGTVRNNARGREVVALEYEAYTEMAEDVLAGLVAVLDERHHLCRVAVHHRVGRLDVGEASVVIAVSAPHRDHALAACKEAIDALKETAPIWKKELYEGGEEWIGQGS